MDKPRIKTITICSSASFFKEAIKLEVKLRKLGFKVKMPLTALRMKRDNDFNIRHYKTWFKNPADYKKKTWLIKNHFNKIRKSDAVLILNYKKRGINGYIGGNTLIEMAIAFHYNKPIFILNRMSGLSFEEEILAFQPIFINGDIAKIS